MQYDDEKLCDYIVAHGFDVDGVGIRIEKPEATIPYAYTLEVADRYPFKSNREPTYPQTVVQTWFVSQSSFGVGSCSEISRQVPKLISLFSRKTE